MAGLRVLPARLPYLAVSVLLHAALAVVLLLAADPLASQPDLGLVWLDLDNQLGHGPQVPEPPPEAPTPAKPAVPDTPSALPVPKQPAATPPKPKRRKRPPPLQRMNLAQVAPGDAAVTLAVRCDHIRRSPYKKAVRGLLEVFYDHRMLLWSSDIDPVRDFDALLIATPNPYRITRTFLAVRHRLPRKTFRASLNRAVESDAGQMNWTAEGADWVGRIPSPPRLRHDPRILIERNGLLLLLEPRLRAQLAARRGRGPKGPQTLIDALMAVGGEEDKQGPSSEPALIVDAVNLSRLVLLPPDVPTPKRLRLTLPATSPTRVTGRAWLRSRKEARRFFDAAQSRLTAGRQSILALMLGLQPLLSRVRLRLIRSQVEANLQLSAAELSNLLAMFRDSIPQAPIQGMGHRVVRPSGLPRTAPGGSNSPASPRTTDD